MYKLSQLATLSASLNKLSRVPAGIETLSVLKALVLSDNNIQDVQTLKDAKLTMLNTLILSKNKLRSDQFSKESGLLRALPQLTTLSLTGNELSEFPFVGKNPLLSVLRLNKNKIADIPPLKRCKNLKFLDLGNNQLTDLKKTAEHLQDLPRLQNLHLRGNPFENGTTSTEEYASICGKLFPTVGLIDGRSNSDAHRKRLERRKAYAKGSTTVAPKKHNHQRATGGSRKRPRDKDVQEGLAKTVDSTAVPKSTFAEEPTLLPPPSSSSPPSKKKKKKKRGKKKKKKKKRTDEPHLSTTVEPTSNREAVSTPIVVTKSAPVERIPKPTTDGGTRIGVLGVTTEIKSRKAMPKDIMKLLHQKPTSAFGQGGASAW